MSAPVLDNGDEEFLRLLKDAGLVRGPTTVERLVRGPERDHDRPDDERPR